MTRVLPGSNENHLSPLIRFERLSAAFLGLILLTLVSLESAQVLTRTFFHSGLFWVDDIRMLLLLTLAWLGAGHLWMTQSHLTVDFVVLSMRIPTDVVQVGADVIAVIGVIWMIPAFMSSISLYGSMMLPMLPLPMGIKFVPAVVGLLMIGCCSSYRLLKRICHVVNKRHRQ